MAKLQPGVNDLATTDPELAAQLVDPELAATVTRGSAKKLVWFCDGTDQAPHPHYEWTAAVNYRSRGKGCAACLGRTIIVGWNDLATVEPELAAQLVEPALATTVTRNSHKRLKWFCDGTAAAPHPRREWFASVADRSGGRGCAACSGKAVIVGWNDLATVEPELAAQLVDLDVARTITRWSNKNVRWFCDGTADTPHPHYEWSSSVANRSAGRGGAACAGQAVIVGWNDLATAAPELVGELVDSTVAETVSRRSDQMVLWFCEGTSEVPHPRHEWLSTVANRYAGQGCPACAGNAVIVGWNDLATLKPELATQLVDPAVAETLTRSSNRKVRWFCTGTSDRPHPRHEWSTTVASRSAGRGCPACVGNAVIVGWNDLATVEPELAAQLVDPTLAVSLTRSSNKSVRWYCEGTTERPHPRREWSATINGRSSGKGCAVCSGKAVLVGWNDLATVEPEVATQLVDPAIATTVTRSSHKRVRWFCEGTTELPHPRREWSATVADRTSGRSCAACSGRAVIVGWNDLATVEPELATQLVDPAIGTTVTRSSGKKLRWFCEGTNEHPHPRREWSAPVYNRSAGVGCAVCARSGFNPGMTGWLYFLRHEGWDMQQIGITNFPDDRIAQHKRWGWDLIEIRKYDDGVLCQANERAGLATLRLRGARVGRSSDSLENKFDGYTEAWPIVSLELESLDQLLEWIRDDEWETT